MVQQSGAGQQGLHLLVHRAPDREQRRIRVLDVTPDELCADLEDHRGAEWRHSKPYREFHDMVCGGFGSEPFALMIVEGELDDAALDDLDRIAGED